MDEAQEILLNSVKSFGISIPSNISSIKDLTSDSIFSICAQFLLLIDEGLSSSSWFPPSLPSSMAYRFKICEDVASAIKALGYRGTLSFHQFLYPSEEDSYKLLRFLVMKLSESSECRKGADDNLNKSHLMHKEVTGDIVKSTQSQPNERAESVEVVQSKNNQISGQLSGSEDATQFQHECVESCVKESFFCRESMGRHSEEFQSAKDGENVSQMENMFLAESEEKLASLQLQLSKLIDGMKNLQSEEKILIEATHAKALEVQKLEHDHEILKAAVDMVFNDQHSTEHFIKQRNDQVESSRRNIMDLESQRNCRKRTEEEREVASGPPSHNVEYGVQVKLAELEEMEQETEATLSEINRRELEYSKLLAELQNLPNIPPRKSYIERITEITKNIWKQDADIHKILKETRELQLESNSMRERLDRTYVVVDETVFREAKKDAMGRQVYRLLTSIHDSFEQISEKILATDRARREATEHEAKIAALSSRRVDIGKLQADLDSIRKENEKLEQQLH